ncbi:MAG: F0F1 ATP synthase subunit B [Clostridia bacterium]|nr:F0F1 ATP synthase subunit B [Clostridia bacterium]
MQTLDVISVNIWQMLASLLNLVLLFLIVKHFLYKPVKKILAQRRSTIDKEYSDADEAKAKALSDKAEYESKLAGAEEKADSIIKNAVEIAEARDAEMLAESKAKADAIVRKAESDALLEKKKAEEDIKREIVDVSTLLTEKLLEREISEDDHKKLIDSVISGIGEE